MISNYGLFNHHEIDNTLVILFNDHKVTSSEEKGEVSVLYHDQEVVGYKIANFIRYAKIKYSGILFLPSKVLIDVINNVLRNNNLDTLEYRKESGYIVIKDKDDIRRVYAKPGIFLRDETISKGHYCSYYDLYIEKENADELITIDEEIKDNTDFFQMEEK